LVLRLARRHLVQRWRQLVMHSDVPPELRGLQIAEESTEALVEQAVEVDRSAASQTRECRAPCCLRSALGPNPLAFLPLTRLVEQPRGIAVFQDSDRLVRPLLDPQGSDHLSDLADTAGCAKDCHHGC